MNVEIAVVHSHLLSNGPLNARVEKEGRDQESRGRRGEGAEMKQRVYKWYVLSSPNGSWVPQTVRVFS